MEHEEVVRTERDEMQTAIDREVHQDHYHTSVQIVKDREMLPEQHTDRIVAIENRNYQHGNPDHVKQRLESEAAQFKNSRSVQEVQHTTTTNPTVTGEHVHHHVHEIIQPVVQKETIQPTVIHTTVPIHEIHQNEPKHHTATQLPALTMDEFKRQGGYLSGREEHTDSFEGEPKSVGGTLGGARASGATSLTAGDSSYRTTGDSSYRTTTGSGTDNLRGDSTTGARATDSTTGGRATDSTTGGRTTDSTTWGRTTDSTTGARTATGTMGAGTSGSGTGATGATGATTSSSGAGGTMGTGASLAEKTRSHGSTSSGGKRHGLIDKLNPMKSSEDRPSFGSVH